MQTLYVPFFYMSKKHILGVSIWIWKVMEIVTSLFYLLCLFRFGKLPPCGNQMEDSVCSRGIIHGVVLMVDIIYWLKKLGCLGENACAHSVGLLGNLLADLKIKTRFLLTAGALTSKVLYLHFYFWFCAFIVQLRVIASVYKALIGEIYWIIITDVFLKLCWGKLLYYFFVVLA